MADVEKLDLLIEDEVGYWRDTGFGMVCMRDVNFWAVGGFGDKFRAKSSWGGEDVHLARQLAKSGLEVHRAVTLGLFHLYHGKECQESVMDVNEYEECMAVKIRSEASVKSLGMRYFSNLGVK